MFKSLFLLGTALSTLAYEKQGNVLKLTQQDFDLARVEHPNMLVKFFAPWCGHCKSLAPTYVQAADVLHQSGSTAKMAQVDCTTQNQLCSRFGIRGYPTVHWFGADATEPVKYTGARTKQGLVQYINERVPIVVAQQEETQGEVVAVEPIETEPVQAEQQKQPQFERDGNLLKLTNQTFQLARNQYDFVFVKFFAPWCGHCKHMAQTWKTFAEQNKRPNVAIAEVDCTVNQEVCNANGIRGYPTLKLFPRGNKEVPYQGQRTIQDFEQFINDQLAVIVPGATPAAQQPVDATEL